MSRGLTKKDLNLIPPEESRVEEGQLKRILSDTIKTIEDNKGQIFEIYEHTRSELDVYRRQLLDLRDEIKVTIDRVDDLAKREREAKQRLADVSQHFNEYSEEIIKAAYEEVSNIQIAHIRERDRELALRQERDKLEIRLRYLNGIVARAEHMAFSIGSVLSYLSKQVSGVIWKIESIQKDKFVGAKIIKATEEERYRISREIHDGAAQDMAHAIVQTSIIEMLMDKDMAEAKKTLGKLREDIKECLVSVRQIIFDMRPMALDDIGLTAAIEQLIKHLEVRGKLKVHLSIEGRYYELPKHVEIVIFRIVQEALNNVINHAQVDSARVRMHYTDREVNVLVADEGVGFDVDSNNNDDLLPPIDGEEDADMPIKREKHFGIIGMEERAKIIGATVKVLSTVGKGTKVHLRIENRLTEM